MKIRNGFVSNSSSSSFIVAVKNGTLEENLNKLKDEIWGLLKNKTPFADIFVDVFAHIKSNAKEFDINDYLYAGETEDEMWEQYPHLKTLLDDGYKLYEISVSSDDYENGGIGNYLYDNADNINFESSDGNLIMVNM